MKLDLTAPSVWDHVAATYAADFQPLLEQFALEALRMAVLEPESDVVDVACGPGTLSCHAARRGHRTRALDFSPEMIAALRRLAASDHLVTLEPTVGDGMALPYEDQSFDAGFSMFGLMFFADRDAGFRELYRVLRPQGRAVVATSRPFAEESMIGLMYRALREATSGADAQAALQPLADPQSCLEHMRRAGFREVVVHDVVNTLDIDSLEVFWDLMERSNAPVAFAKSELGKAWPDVRAAILTRLRNEFGNAPPPCEFRALLSVGIR